MYSYLFAMIIAAAGAAYGTWQVQNWRFGTQIAELKTARSVDNAEARRMEAARSRNVTEALNAQVKRTQSAQRNAADALATSDGLRDDLATARRASQQSAAARDQYAATLDRLFVDCEAAYRDVAKSAQGHADDVRLLLEAWPK